MPSELKIIQYPDPRLLKTCAPVTVFDERLHDIATQMIHLMHTHRGVGLAGAQVALDMRLFVMNPTGEEGQDRVYVNPQLSDAEGDEEGEEGCLSIPGINARIWRFKSITMNAQDLTGQHFEEKASGFIARIWQHETDHLDGKLIIDKMGPLAKMAARRTLNDLRKKWDENNGQ